jgi:hypothetical protein
MAYLGQRRRVPEIQDIVMTTKDFCHLVNPIVKG